MTRPDFQQIFSLLTGAFNVPDDEREANARLFFDRFGQGDTAVFRDAVHRCIKKGGNFPKVNELRALAVEVVNEREHDQPHTTPAPFELNAQRERELMRYRAGEPIPGVGVAPLTEDGKLDFMGMWRMVEAKMEAQMRERSNELKGES